jgi:hypothetical protein
MRTQTQPAAVWLLHIDEHGTPAERPVELMHYTDNARRHAVVVVLDGPLRNQTIVVEVSELRAGNVVE